MTESTEVSLTDASKILYKKGNPLYIIASWVSLYYNINEVSLTDASKILYKKGNPLYVIADHNCIIISISWLTRRGGGGGGGGPVGGVSLVPTVITQYRNDFPMVMSCTILLCMYVTCGLITKYLALVCSGAIIKFLEACYRPSAHTLLSC